MTLFRKPRARVFAILALAGAVIIAGTVQSAQEQAPVPEYAGDIRRGEFGTWAGHGKCSGISISESGYTWTSPGC
jgi:hypothetical protein